MNERMDSRPIPDSPFPLQSIHKQQTFQSYIKYDKYNAYSM